MVAMREDISFMARNHVCELVDLLFGSKTIENKWVLKIKCKENGSVEKYKAHLMVKGYTQR